MAFLEESMPLWWFLQDIGFGWKANSLGGIFVCFFPFLVDVLTLWYVFSSQFSLNTGVTNVVQKKKRIEKNLWLTIYYIDFIICALCMTYACISCTHFSVILMTNYLCQVWLTWAVSWQHWNSIMCWWWSSELDFLDNPEDEKLIQKRWNVFKNSRLEIGFAFVLFLHLQSMD